MMQGVSKRHRFPSETDVFLQKHTERGKRDGERKKAKVCEKIATRE